MPWTFLFGLLILCGLTLTLVYRALPAHFSITHKILLSLTFLGVTAGTYYWLGNPVAEWYYLKKQAQPKVTQADIKKMGGAKTILPQFEKLLQTHPNDPKGWLLLAHVYKTQNKLSQAAKAYQKAYALDPSNTTIAMETSETLFLANGQRLTPFTRGIIKKLLKQQPRNPVALNILATDAYFKGRYNKAITLWEALLETFPAKSQETKDILKAIATAQQKRAQEK